MERYLEIRNFGEIFGEQFLGEEMAKAGSKDYDKMNQTFWTKQRNYVEPVSLVGKMLRLQDYRISYEAFVDKKVYLTFYCESEDKEYDTTVEFSDVVEYKLLFGRDVFIKKSPTGSLTLMCSLCMQHV